MLRSLRHGLKELGNSQRLVSMPREERAVLVYSEDVFSYVHFAELLRELRETHGRSAVYVTSDPDDPLLSAEQPGLEVYYLKRMLPGYIPRIDSPVFITTMPDLGNLHIQRPRPESRCVYVFHSLHSIPMVYRPGAFDHYDVFFCTGEHQYRELETHFRSLDRPAPRLCRVGYPKLDQVYAESQRYRKQHPDLATILVASSWGPGNVLEAHGVDLVDRLLAAGHRVVVRPHPCFFQDIYPGGRQIVEQVARRFEGHERFVLERSIDNRDSFYEADLMITGWSGAAFEYAFGAERPVLFLDVPRKVFNPDWQKLGLPPFEDCMRSEVGRVISPDAIDSIESEVASLIQGQAQYREQLRKVRERSVYNFGSSAKVAAALVENLLEEM